MCISGKFSLTQKAGWLRAVRQLRLQNSNALPFPAVLGENRFAKPRDGSVSA
jgi:hypothetical protein